MSTQQIILCIQRAPAAPVADTAETSDPSTMGSSTTSDLGSSIERSRHMRQICDASPHPALQRAHLVSRRPFIHVHGCVQEAHRPSPPKPTPVAAPACQMGMAYVKLRSRSAGRTQQRPHSVTELATGQQSNVGASYRNSTLFDYDHYWQTTPVAECECDGTRRTPIYLLQVVAT